MNRRTFLKSLAILPIATRINFNLHEPEVLYEVTPYSNRINVGERQIVLKPGLYTKEQLNKQVAKFNHSLFWVAIK